jgi:cytoskeleton protein RodZ
MLANYARFLDLDSDQILERYAEALQLQLSERVNSPVSLTTPGERGQSGSGGSVSTPRAARSGSARRAPARPQAVWRRFLTPDMVFVGALILVVVGFALWSLAQVTGTQGQAGQPTLPSIAEMLLKTGTPGTPVPTGAGLPGGTATLAPGGGAGLAPATPTYPAVTAQPITSGVLQVYIVARQRAYLKMTVDGKVMFDGRVVPGNAYSFGGNQRIDLLTGNAAALQVLFNQNDLGYLGLVGQVRSLIFTDKGVVTPTPSFSPTPTRTQQPTSTLRPSQVLPTPTITPFIP